MPKRWSPGCNCCEGNPCWPCDLPLGFSIVTPSRVFDCQDCTDFNGTYLRATATYDNWDNPVGFDPCRARWYVRGEQCCTESETPGFWILSRIFMEVIIYLTPSGLATASVKMYRGVAFVVASIPVPVDAEPTPCGCEWFFANNTFFACDGWQTETNLFTGEHSNFLYECEVTFSVDLSECGSGSQAMTQDTVACDPTVDFNVCDVAGTVLNLVMP